jgi:hypothetical protein
MTRLVEECNRRMLRARDAMDRTFAEPLCRPDVTSCSRSRARRQKTMPPPGQVRELVAKGASGFTIGFTTNNCRNL